jgi:hypothetical protein
MNTQQKTIASIGLSAVFMGINAASAQLGEVEIHGFMSQGYMYSTDYNYQTMESTDGTLQFNETAINFSTDVTDQLRAGAQLITRDYGYVGNNQLEIDWAYGDYSINDKIGFRAGRVKIPMGLYNETRDIDLVRSSILLPQSVYNESYRDLMSSVNGISFYGMLPMGSAGDLQYKFIYGHSSLDTENSGLTAYIERTELADIENIEGGENLTLDLVWLTPVDGLRVGTTAMQFDMGTSGSFANAAWGGILQPGVFSSDFDLYTASAEYLIGDLTLNSEFRYFKGVSDIVMDLSGIGGSSAVNAEDIYETAGSYAGASYRFSPLLEMGSYYSFVRDVEDGFDSHDVALSARFDLNEFWIVKLEGHWLNGSIEAFPLNDNPTLAESDGEDWFMFALKTTFSF